jgi:rhamnosyltransferase subunit B
MKVLLVPVGSTGDIHPFLAIGLALRARGHDAELVTNPVFEPLVRSQGLGFTAVGTRQQYEQTIAQPKLWHPIDGLGVMWRGLIRHSLIPVFDHLRSMASAGRCVVLASPVAFGARVAQLKLGLPLVSAYTAATMLRSSADPMTLAHWQVPRWVPAFARRAAWGALDRHKLEPMARPALQALAAHAGVAMPATSVFGHWMHSPLAGVTLFPDWFAPAPADWPPQVVQAGFPMFDGDQAGATDPLLASFLEQGPAPVVFMPGTAAHDNGGFFRAARQACDQLGLRGLLLGQGAAQAVADRPVAGRFFTADYLPFGSLLPHAAALVHHGGIGTLAQAIRAGLPQLVLPRAYDQFDNAMRLQHLGVGHAIPAGDSALATLPARLKALLDNQALRDNCRRLARRVDTPAALDRICALVEGVA